MDGVFNTIKKGLDDIINKLNQISLFTNKTNENKSVKSVVKSTAYNDLKAKNGAETTIFEYNGNGYIEKIKIYNFLQLSVNANFKLSDFKIIIDDDTFLKNFKLHNITGNMSIIKTEDLVNSHVSILNYNNNSWVIDIPIRKMIKNNIKCICTPIGLIDNSDNPLICSAWIEER